MVFIMRTSLGVSRKSLFSHRISFIPVQPINFIRDLGAILKAILPPSFSDNIFMLSHGFMGF